MKPLLLRTLARQLATSARTAEIRHEPSAGRMSAWQIHGYGDLSELQQTNARVPHINAPDEVLVKVDAASVNPIDVAMIKGYGSRVLNVMRCSDVEFPLTPGRDFSGTVEWRGPDTALPVGTRVWGVLPPHWQGSLAHYTIAKKSWIAPQPASFSSVEASSILYAGLTAWSGLWITAGLGLRGARGRRVLVLGAAGGVGSMAVQLLRAANAFVICSCSTDAVPLVQSLGADMVLDRKHADYENSLKEYGPYDVILDCAGLGASEAHARDWRYGTYVTFTTPLLRNADELGLLPGALTSALSLLCQNVRGLSAKRSVRWAYFVPSATGIAHLQRLADSGKLRAVVDEVFGWEEVPRAMQRVQDGHLRGKVVVDFNKHSH